MGGTDLGRGQTAPVPSAPCISTPASKAPLPDQPEPLVADIEPAVAISWDSQAEKVYEIHSITDLDNWTLVIDEIQGTGEKLPQCFIRSDTEIYYRVEESN